jgi:hypothetical protein
MTSTAELLPAASESPPVTEAAVKEMVKLVVGRCSVVLGTRNTNVWGPLDPGVHVNVGPEVLTNV